MNIKEWTFSFLRDEDGLTTVEYAIAGGLVGAAVIGAFTLLGGNVGNFIDYLAGVIGGLTP